MFLYLQYIISKWNYPNSFAEYIVWRCVHEILNACFSFRYTFLFCLYDTLVLFYIWYGTAIHSHSLSYTHVHRKSPLPILCSQRGFCMQVRMYNMYIPIHIMASSEGWIFRRPNPSASPTPIPSRTKRRSAFTRKQLGRDSLAVLSDMLNSNPIEYAHAYVPRAVDGCAETASRCFSMSKIEHVHIKYIPQAASCSRPLFYEDKSLFCNSEAIS